jgi:hypothetical protein
MILLILKDLWRLPSRYPCVLFGETPSSGATAVGVSSWPVWKMLPDSLLGLKKEAIVWELDGLGGDRSLKPLRGTPGDVLDWRGGVAMRALPRTPSQILRARAQTGDRQEIF